MYLPWLHAWIKYLQTVPYFVESLCKLDLQLQGATLVVHTNLCEFENKVSKGTGAWAFWVGSRVPHLSTVSAMVLLGINW